jgi:hypothetical protein
MEAPMSRRTEVLAKLVSGPCEWPDCICAHKTRHWWEMFDRLDRLPAPLDPEVVDAVHLGSFLTLSCIAKNCPDRRHRGQATIELLHPVYSQLEDHRWPDTF